MILTAAAEPQAIDLVRIVALVLGSAVVGAVGVVAAVYYVVWRKHATLHRDGKVSKWRGLLPRHVVGISVSYGGLALASMYEVATRLREPITTRPVLYIVLYLIGTWALWDVLGHSRYRLHGMKNIPQGGPPDVNPDLDSTGRP